MEGWQTMTAADGQAIHATSRVQLHPATDAWMMGDRFGTVVKVGRKVVTVKMDRGRTLRVHPENIQEVIHS